MNAVTLDVMETGTMSTMKAVRAHQPGGPEVLRYEDAPIPAVGTGEVLCVSNTSTPMIRITVPLVTSPA